jgi:hypothetical protein
MWPAEMERKSSYLMNGTPKVIEAGPILRLLGGKKAYERFVLAGISESHNEEYYAVEDQRFLGEEDFGEELSREAGEKEERKTKKPIETTVKEIAKRLAARGEMVLARVKSGTQHATHTDETRPRILTRA